MKSTASEPGLNLFFFFLRSCYRPFRWILKSLMSLLELTIMAGPGEASNPPQGISRFSGNKISLVICCTEPRRKTSTCTDIRK